MAQLVKCLTLDFGSGHDLMVHEFEPADDVEPVWDSLSLSLSLSLWLSPIRSFSLSQNKKINFKKTTNFSKNLMDIFLRT